MHAAEQTYLDVTLSVGGQLNQPIPEKWNAFVYVLSGQLTTSARDGGDARVEAHHTVVCDTGGDGILIRNEGGIDTRLVVIAGRPIGEPIVQHGPFVMCSDEEIGDAIDDFRRGRNGFEGAARWRSELGQALRR